jgi:hypothetical protein
MGAFNWLLIIPVVVVGLMFGFFVLIVVTAMWEKRLIVVYDIPLPGHELPTTAYSQQANVIAAQLGLTHYGTFHHGKGGIYKVRYDFWLAPDRSLILLVGGGKIAAMPADAVWITSPLKDGRYLMTTDFTGEAELSGLISQEVQRDVGLVFLIDRQRHRLKTSPVPPAQFGDDALSDYLQMRKRQIERMVEQGDARWLDAEQMSWKHTLKGALRFYFQAVWGVGKK